MRISDWSSDVCSSDLGEAGQGHHAGGRRGNRGTGRHLSRRTAAVEGRSGGGRTRETGGGEILGKLEGRGTDRRVAEQRQHQLGGYQRRPRDSAQGRSEEHTSELQSLMRISYAVFCLK